MLTNYKQIHNLEKYSDKIKEKVLTSFTLGNPWKGFWKWSTMKVDKLFKEFLFNGMEL